MLNRGGVGKKEFFLVRAGGLALMLVMIRIHNWNKKKESSKKREQQKGGRVHRNVCFFLQPGCGETLFLP